MTYGINGFGTPNPDDYRKKINGQNDANNAGATKKAENTAAPEKPAINFKQPTINLENANALYARANVIANTKNQEVVNAFIAKYANVEKYLANMDIKTKERIENDTTRNFAYLPVADGSNKNFLA